MSVQHRRQSSSPEPSGVPADVEEFGEECGGKGGVPYRIAVRPPARITRVTVWHRQFVDGLQLETEEGPLPKIGGTGKDRGIHVDKFQLEPDEFITGVSVEYWTYIDRITFHTNKRDYGPYGGPGSRLKKSLSAPPGRRVAGFKGRHWELIDSIQLMVL
jgi:hypothetical protein